MRNMPLRREPEFRSDQKIGFACENRVGTSEMLNMYFEDIRKYGNDPMKVGVDGILISTPKVPRIRDLYGKTFQLLERFKILAKPSHSPTAIEKELRKYFGTVEDILKDRNVASISLPNIRVWISPFIEK